MGANGPPSRHPNGGDRPAMWRPKPVGGPKPWLNISRPGARMKPKCLARAASAWRPELLDAERSRRLSTGEKQRLALLRALLLEPPVLLLDEPTGALDQASVSRVEHVVRSRLAEGVAVVMVTHDDALAERLGDQRYRMNARRLTDA